MPFELTSPSMMNPGSTRRAWMVATASMSLAACSLHPDRDHDGEDAPRALPLATKPRVAWVLSSGGPRGFVHVGVIKALDELGLVPDLIVGASAGALVGVMRAAGLRGDDLAQLALNISLMDIARLAVGAEERLSPFGLADWVRQQVGAKPLQALSIPMASVAYNQASQSVVAFTAGDAGLAVAASSAIEGQFSPVRIRGERHADADRHMPLPVRVARAMGAQRVLAVDASVHVDRAPPGAERYREGDTIKLQNTQIDAKLADVVLHPDFGYWVNLSREFRERAIAAGYRDTLAQATRLRSLHAA